MGTAYFPLVVPDPVPAEPRSLLRTRSPIHDRSIKINKVAAGPLGTAYFLLVVRPVPDRTPRSDLRIRTPDHDRSSKRQQSSSRADGNCLLLARRPNPTHRSVATLEVTHPISAAASAPDQQARRMTLPAVASASN